MCRSSEQHSERNPEQGSNRDAIGAHLLLTLPDGQSIRREVHGSIGYLSVHPKEQHFGLGKAVGGNLEVRWPNGQVQVVEGLQAGHRYRLTQASGALSDAGDIERH